MPVQRVYPEVTVSNIEQVALEVSSDGNSDQEVQVKSRYDFVKLRDELYFYLGIGNCKESIADK